MKTKSRTLLLLSPLTLLCSLAMTGQAHAQQLITFDAPNAGTGAFQGTLPLGINLEGTITGTVTDSDNGTHGFVRTRDGRYTNFDAPLADPILGCTCVSSINDLGAVAGSAYDSNDVIHGFVRTPDGEFVTFDDSQAPAGTGSFQGTSAVSINDLGVIAGTYTDANYAVHGFVRTPNGNITTFDAPASSGYTRVGSINNFGAIAGQFYGTDGAFHNFVRTADGKFTVPDPPGAAGGIGTNDAYNNDLGAIAGSYVDPSTDTLNGFLRWPGGDFTEFSAPEAGTGAYTSNGATSYAGTSPLALNLEGTTTGFVASDFDSQGNSLAHAFVRTADGHASTFDIPGQVTVPNPYGDGSSGRAINTVGVITGYWNDTNYALHGFLRIPRGFGHIP